jgi:hypothetical protein
LKATSSNICDAQSVDLYKQALSAYSRQANRTEWAVTHCEFGWALLAQAELFGDDAREVLNKATVSFRDALSVLTRSTQPLEWARAQAGYGLALTARSALPRSHNREVTLDQASFAYTQALSVLEPTTRLAEWAQAQRGLANTQLQRAKLVGNADVRNARSRLEEASTAANAVIAVAPKESDLSKRASRIVLAASQNR